MSYSRSHIIYVSGLISCIENHEDSIKQMKKRIKKDRKKLNKVKFEALQRFKDLAVSSLFLKDIEWSAYPTRTDGLSLSIIVFIEGSDYNLDMSDWIGHDINTNLIKSFDEMLRLKMHDLDKTPPKVLDWDEDQNITDVK